MGPRLFVAGICCVGLCAHAAGGEPAPLTGRWVVTSEQFATPRYFKMNLVQDGPQVRGDFDGDELTGSVQGDTFTFHGKDANGGSEDATVKLADGKLSGTIVLVYSNDLTHPSTQPFSATKVASRRNGPPRRLEFSPTVFHRQFSAQIPPVLSLFPGDTLHTTTVDAGGVDAKGVQRSLGGNPQTGPFFIEGALPGDTLVVHVLRLKLNRDYAISDDGVVPRGLTDELAVKLKDTGKPVRWHLDLAKGLATSDAPGDHLKRFVVPLRPMLGCVATAPGPDAAPMNTGDSGSIGGNLDFNELVEGATISLPVNVPGALLYFGDGHAAQGDGELNGNALETSLDVELSVDLLPGKRAQGVRLESPTHLMAMGLDGSLDGAFRQATANMARWLSEAYQLTPSEVAQVLGTSAEYRISEVADRNAGVVLKLSRERLKALTVPGASATP
jgi:amidase